MRKITQKFLKLFFVLISISSLNLYAFNSKTAFSKILCVDAEDYWDGPYTVEINAVDDQMLAEVYEQSYDEGRALVSRINVTQHRIDSDLLITGKNFELKIDNPISDVPNLAHILFMHEYAVIDDDYSCIVFSNH